MKPRFAWSIRSVFFVLGSASLLVLFQNCGDVKLAEKVEGNLDLGSTAYRGKITIDFCPSLTAASKYRVSRVSVSNLNAASWNGTMMIDNDADGIPDAIETQLGYDPELRRSFGVLDGICQDHGGKDQCTHAAACSTATLAPGISACDLSAFLAPGSTTPQGFDSDLDGIPDFLEMLRGTNPIAYDVLADSDHDGRINLDEYRLGQDQRTSVNVPAEDQVTYTVTELADTCGTGQNVVKIEITNLPLMPTSSFIDPDPYRSLAGDLDLSHHALENVVMISIETKPDNAALKSELSMRYQIIDYDRPAENGNLNNSHFVFMGTLN